VDRRTSSRTPARPAICTTRSTSRERRSTGAKQIKPSGVFYNPDVFTPKKTKKIPQAKRAEWDTIQETAKAFNLPLVPIKQPEIAKTKPKKTEKKEKSNVTL
jgi:hypothetical protein